MAEKFTCIKKVILTSFNMVKAFYGGKKNYFGVKSGTFVFENVVNFSFWDGIIS